MSGFRLVAVGVALVALLLAPSSTPVVAAGRPDTSAPEPARWAGPAGGGTGFVLQQLLTGYTRPVAVTSDGRGNRLFIVEQTGRIRVATRRRVSAPWQGAGVFLDLRKLVHQPDSGQNERGLLGLAFHPDYLENDLFYVFYTRARDDRNVLVEYRRSTALRARPRSARVVLSLPHPNENHNGGAIHFGPDGYLYLSTGDHVNSARARDIESLHGKILRLDPTDPAGPARLTAPPDNPFFGAAPGADLVWAYGFRNPWRMSHDASTGDLWIGDVGHGEYEEIDHALGPDAGRALDFGWDLCEAEHVHKGTDADCGEPPNTTTRPVVEYPHTVAGRDNAAVTGGYVYRGTDQAALQGRYFFGDYGSGRIWSIATTYDDPAGTLPTPLRTNLNVSSFGVDGRGELYVVDLNGTIHLVVEE